MCPRKKHLSTLMLSLCIVTGALSPGNATASRLAITDPQAQRTEDKSAGDRTANTAQRPKHQGVDVPPETRRFPRPAAAEKLAHLPVACPFDQTAAPQPLALMPSAKMTLARGMTLRKLLRRRALG